MSQDANPKPTGALAGVVVLVPIACCVGLPLLLAVGISAGVAFALGGAVIGGLGLLGVLGLLAMRFRRRRAARGGVPAQRIGGHA